MHSNKRVREEPADLLSTLDKLRSFILGNTFDAGLLPDQILDCIPTVIVLGDQSSGKSSLLSAIAKYDLPVGTGRTTASRIELRFRQSSTEKSTIKIEMNDGKVHSEQEIQEASISLAHDFLASQATDDNAFFTQGAIVLNIEGPNEKNMTLVDLPGLIIPVDEVSLSRSKSIYEMIDRYISKPNCLIVHVLDVSKDIDTTISRSQLIKTTGISTNRVVNVFTKFDIIGETYHEAKLNELHTKVQQGIFVQCRDVQGKSVEVETFTKVDPRFDYGREHLLVKVEKFTQDYLQSKKKQLTSLLKTFQSSIIDTLRRVGHREKQGHEIYRTYTGALSTQLTQVKSNERPFAQLVDRVHGVAPINYPLPLEDQVIHDKLVDERGLRLCSPIEAIIQSYVKSGCQHLQGELNKWEADLTHALKDDIQKSLFLKNYPSACRLIDAYVEHQAKEHLTTILNSFIDETQTYLDESHTSPTLFNRQEFDSFVNQHTSSLGTLRKVVHDLTTGLPPAQVIAYLQRSISDIENRVGEVDMIKSQIQAYWKARMHVLQNNLHDKLGTIRNKLFDYLGESIHGFEDIDQLDEDLNDAHLRQQYLHFCAPSFCDPALLDQPMAVAAVERAGVPWTSFKYSENTGQFQVIREQAGTFADSIRLWSED